MNSIDLKTNPEIISGHLTLGTNHDPKGHVLDANSLYFLKDGKPWLPVMGEFHYSRYPRAQWEESILKMKACGINVIASYVFWIHHEEIEGQFDWTGNRDLHYFATLCAKHGMYLYPRIGPWCHGEARNGGLPDWLLPKCHTRSNDPIYLGYVGTWYHEIGKQLQGEYFKEGGPVIGTQIENEYGFANAKGLDHMLTLKRMARESGIDVPYYTATGWQGADHKQTDLLLMWGAYPEAPWDHSTKKLAPLKEYLFSSIRQDPNIGTDLLGKQQVDPASFTGSIYPYATAEMGGGMQNTYHRRPIVEASDVASLAYVKVGSGANLLGYYMFHGGSHPIGKLSTMQESRATRYPNDYPLISYDFQAPIGEWGQLRPSYRAFKTLHLFLNDFGAQLAPEYAAFPDAKPSGPTDTNTLRWSVRSHNDSGFIFINNFERQVQMQDLAGEQLQLKLKSGATLTIPEKPITIAKDAIMIWPFNLDLSGAKLRYATAQPLCTLIDNKIPLYVFFAPEGIAPEYVFEANGIKTIAAINAHVTKASDAYHVSDFKSGMNCVQTITLTNGNKIRILTLTHQQALDCWKGKAWGSDRLFISDRDLTFPSDTACMQSTGQAAMSVAIYPNAAKLSFSHAKQISHMPDGIFTRYHIAMPERTIKVTLTPDVDASTIASNTSAAQPGPQYGPKWQALTGTPSWRIGIPRNALDGLSDAFLKIDYAGDTAAAYLNDTLIADDFYFGQSMPIALKRFAPGVLGSNLHLQIVPLTDERNIFFEDGIREPLHGKSVAEVRSVTVVPQYETMVTD